VALAGEERIDFDLAPGEGADEPTSHRRKGSRDDDGE
jgi:FdhD protein